MRASRGQAAKGGPDTQLSVLALDEELPLPADSGKRIRVWNLMRRLAARNRVTLLCYAAANDPHIAQLRAAGIQVETVPPLEPHSGAALYGQLLLNLASEYPYSVVKHYTERYRARVRELLADGRFDLVHCEWTPYARYLEDTAGVPTVIATHNVECRIWERRAQNAGNPASRVFFGGQARKMAAFEQQALRRATAVTAVSRTDLEQLRTWGLDNCSLVENGVDLEYFQPTPGEPEKPEILFLGSLDWYPNQDALDYFLDDIFGAIRQRRPDARLRVVGRNPSPDTRQRLAREAGAELVGHVDDVRPYLASASLVVVPLRIGGGSRIKILESLAAGKAVVSTTIGAEGIEVVDGEHIAIADRAPEFADRVVALLGSAELRRRLGQRGRELVVAEYSWDKMADAMESVWLLAAGRHAAVPGVRPALAARQAPGDAPFISVVIPVRNEEKHLGGVLDSLLAQQYPADRFEIVVADGGSTDSTPQLVADYARRAADPEIKLVNNPAQLSSAGRNAGVRNSRGEIVLFIDGHCHIPSAQLLSDTARLMQESGADCLARPQPLLLARTTFQHAVAQARATWLGHGRDSLIYSTSVKGFVDPTSSGACYRRDVFQAVGSYDERFDACEDVEFNHRVKAAGLRCYTDPSLTVEYEPRGSVSGLFRQMMRYGRGRFRLARKHRGAFTAQQAVPALLLAGILLGALTLPWPGPLRVVYAAVLALYALLVLAASLPLARHGLRVALLAPVVLVTVHLGLGAGFWAELLAQVFGAGARRKAEPAPEQVKLHSVVRPEVRSHDRSAGTGA